MSKDPAFLFYYQDWLVGTGMMTYRQKGAYIDLLAHMADQGGILELNQIRSILGTSFKRLWPKLAHKFIVNEGFYNNTKLTEVIERRKKFCESRRKAKLKCDEDNVRIYFLRDNDSGNIKIGSSVNPARRFNEITNQTISVAGSSTTRNYKLIWYSDPTLRKNEKLIHTTYEDKRVVGEWFNLSVSELNEITKRFFGVTYVERTIKHTTAHMGNENETENGNTLTPPPVNIDLPEGKGKDFLNGVQNI